MLARLLKLLATLAFLAVLAGQPTEAFAHAGHKNNVGIEPAANGTAVANAAFVRAVKVQQEASALTLISNERGCASNTCSCSVCSCASCHCSALMTALDTDLRLASANIVPLTIAHSIRVRADASAEQPPKSFA